jgi:hypothetical protein
LATLTIIYKSDFEKAVGLLKVPKHMGICRTFLYFYSCNESMDIVQNRSVLHRAVNKHHACRAENKISRWAVNHNVAFSSPINSARVDSGNVPARVHKPELLRADDDLTRVNATLKNIYTTKYLVPNNYSVLSYLMRV